MQEFTEEDRIETVTVERFHLALIDAPNDSSDSQLVQIICAEYLDPYQNLAKIRKRMP